MSKLRFTAICAILCLAACGKAETSFEPQQKLQSPDGKLEVGVGLSADGTPLYALTYQGADVIKPSRLGFRLLDQEDLLNGFSITDVQTGGLDETWEPVWGEEDQIRKHYNELVVTF